ncbi:hypothetical protein CALVIDRAFT_547792 [Calocera viscosa TUFC12733]|uniref:Integrase catalytic domain-containing protein n=1 Tax=Calocera viscosa (strain TUFC12733) TaxID=1330018 RepID=A0A167FK93_CALVF|nr:hypothetical protein CALVIDRAFT_547792 [Calocera viscosa TUFC12733]
MNVLRHVHDDIGYKGYRSLPTLSHDVKWYLQTCPECQRQQMQHVHIPPTAQLPSPLFYKAHCDTMFMEVSKGSNQIVTDNGTLWVNAMSTLSAKFGIKAIRISGYKSRANGIVKQSHRSVRESIVKASSHDISRWPEVTPAVFWAERISIHSSTGLSPYYMAHGIHPMLPMDIVEVNFLVPPPDSILSRADMIAYRAQDLTTIAQRILKARQNFANTIRDYDHKPGDLVLLRNSSNDSPLRDKTLPRYIGPYIVAKRNRGGAYILAELDGTPLRYSIAAFRAIPLYARGNMKIDRKKIIESLDNAPYLVEDTETHHLEGELDPAEDEDSEPDFDPP